MKMNKRNAVVLFCLVLLVLSSVFCDNGDKLGEKVDRKAKDIAGNIADGIGDAADVAECMTSGSGALVCAETTN